METKSVFSFIWAKKLAALVLAHTLGVVTLATEEIVSLCYSFFAFPSLWPHREQLLMLKYTTKIYLLQTQFSKFTSQNCAGIAIIFHIFWIPKTIFTPKNLLHVLRYIIHCPTACWKCFGVENLTPSLQTAFLGVLSQKIRRKNLSEQSACWTAWSGKLFFLSWLLHFRASALHCNCVTHCMH